MATTNIELEIENITGVANADEQFIISAQKLVVASVPKDLMWQYASVDSAVTEAGKALDGDTVLQVSYDGGQIADEVSPRLAYDVGDDNSIYKATARYPKYYIKDGKIYIKPDPTAGSVSYVDYEKLDDDSDLRNAVINYACAKEFAQLASFSTFPSISWTGFPAVPIAPSSPSFTTPAIGDESISLSADAPTFIPPVMSTPDWSDTEDWITAEEDSEMLAARVQEIQAKVGEYSARLQEAQAQFNKENAIYQVDLQEKTAEMQIAAQKEQQGATLLLQQEVQEYTAKLQKYQNDVGAYSAEVNKIITANQAELQEWQMENTKFAMYAQESTRHYQMAQSEVSTYIQTNSKMIQAQAQIATQRGQ